MIERKFKTQNSNLEGGFSLESGSDKFLNLLYFSESKPSLVLDEISETLGGKD